MITRWDTRSLMIFVMGSGGCSQLRLTQFSAVFSWISILFFKKRILTQRPLTQLKIPSKSVSCSGLYPQLYPWGSPPRTKTQLIYRSSTKTDEPFISPIFISLNSSAVLGLMNTNGVNVISLLVFWQLSWNFALERYQKLCFFFAKKKKLVLRNLALISDQMESLLTIQDVARMLSVSVPTVRRLIRDARIKHIRISDRTIRFHKSHVEEFLFEHSVSNFGEME